MSLSTLKDTDVLRQDLTDRLDRARMDKWTDMLNANFSAYFALFPSKVRRRVRRGIPAVLRGIIWQKLSGSQALIEDSGAAKYYWYLRQPATHVTDEIERDVYRTFPRHPFFRERGGLGQTSLGNVLKAFAAYDPTVGYCQGMGFLAAMMLTQMNEVEAFWTLVTIMEDDRYALRGLFTPGLPRIRVLFKQLEYLMRRYLPRLADHLGTEQVDPSLYATQWFMTLFGGSKLTWECQLRVWDQFFCEGIRAVLRVAVAILASASVRLTRTKFDNVTSIIEAVEAQFNAETLFASALQFKVTDSELLQVQREAIEESESMGIPLHWQRLRRIEPIPLAELQGFPIVNGSHSKWHVGKLGGRHSASAARHRAAAAMYPFAQWHEFATRDDIPLVHMPPETSAHGESASGTTSSSEKGQSKKAATSIFPSSNNLETSDQLRQLTGEKLLERQRYVEEVESKYWFTYVFPSPDDIAEQLRIAQQRRRRLRYSRLPPRLRAIVAAAAAAQRMEERQKHGEYDSSSLNMSLDHTDLAMDKLQDGLGQDRIGGPDTINDESHLMGTSVPTSPSAKIFDQSGDAHKVNSTAAKRDLTGSKTSGLAALDEVMSRSANGQGPEAGQSSTHPILGSSNPSNLDFAMEWFPFDQNNPSAAAAAVANQSTIAAADYYGLDDDEFDQAETLTYDSIDSASNASSSDSGSDSVSDDANGEHDDSAGFAGDESWYEYLNSIADEAVDTEVRRKRHKSYVPIPWLRGRRSKKLSAAAAPAKEESLQSDWSLFPTAIPLSVQLSATEDPSLAAQLGDNVIVAAADERALAHFVGMDRSEQQTSHKRVTDATITSAEDPQLHGSADDEEAYQAERVLKASLSNTHGATAGAFGASLSRGMAKAITRMLDMEEEEAAACVSSQLDLASPAVLDKEYAPKLTVRPAPKSVGARLDPSADEDADDELNGSMTDAEGADIEEDETLAGLQAIQSDPRAPPVLRSYAAWQLKQQKSAKRAAEKIKHGGKDSDDGRPKTEKGQTHPDADASYSNSQDATTLGTASSTASTTAAATQSSRSSEDDALLSASTLSAIERGELAYWRELSARRKIATTSFFERLARQHIADQMRALATKSMASAAQQQVDAVMELNKRANAEDQTQLQSLSDELPPVAPTLASIISQQAVGYTNKLEALAAVADSYVGTVVTEARQGPKQTKPKARVEVTLPMTAASAFEESARYTPFRLATQDDGSAQAAADEELVSTLLSESSGVRKLTVVPELDVELGLEVHREASKEIDPVNQQLLKVIQRQNDPKALYALYDDPRKLAEQLQSRSAQATGTAQHAGTGLRGFDQTCSGQESTVLDDIDAELLQEVGISTAPLDDATALSMALDVVNIQAQLQSQTLTKPVTSKQSSSTSSHPTGKQPHQHGSKTRGRGSVSSASHANSSSRNTNEFGLADVAAPVARTKSKSHQTAGGVSTMSSTTSGDPGVATVSSSQMKPPPSAIQEVPDPEDDEPAADLSTIIAGLEQYMKKAPY